MKLLGIDVGTGGTRSVVVDSNGSVVASSTAEHAPFTSPQTGWANGNQRTEIACVGFSGQMHSAGTIPTRFCATRRPRLRPDHGVGVGAWSYVEEACAQAVRVAARVAPDASTSALNE
jgi:hypothetical protein